MDFWARGTKSLIRRSLILCQVNGRDTNYTHSHTRVCRQPARRLPKVRYCTLRESGASEMSAAGVGNPKNNYSTSFQ